MVSVHFVMGKRSLIVCVHVGEISYIYINFYILIFILVYVFVRRVHPAYLPASIRSKTDRWADGNSYRLGKCRILW